MRPANLVFAVVVTAVLGACASQPAQPPAQQPANEVAATGDLRVLGARHCIRYTGTRRELPEGQCALVSGVVLYNEDLQRTGAATVSGALNTLRP